MQLLASALVVAALAVAQGAPTPSDLAREAHARQVSMNHAELIALVEPEPVKSLASAILDRLDNERPEIQAKQVEAMFDMASVDDVRELSANVLVGRLLTWRFDGRRLRMQSTSHEIRDSS